MSATKHPSTAKANPFGRPIFVRSPLYLIAACGHATAHGTLTIPDLHGWLVNVTLHSDGEHIAVTGLEIKFDTSSGEPDRSLTGAQLRAVPISLLVRMLRDFVRDNVPDDEATALEAERRLDIPRPSWWTSEPPEPRKEWTVPTLGDQRTGAKGHSDAELAGIAYDYVQLLDSPRPIALLAETTGLSMGAIKSRIEKCRKRNLLTSPDKRGQAGGTLTKKARRLLGLDE